LNSISEPWRRQRCKEATSFRGQKILQPSHPGALFSSKKVDDQRQSRFTVKMKQIKRSDVVTLLFSVHTITEAKQYVGLGRAKPGLEPGRWIFQPSHPGVAPPLIRAAAFCVLLAL